MPEDNLTAWGLNKRFSALFNTLETKQKNLEPARIIGQKSAYIIERASGRCTATVSGAFRHAAAGKADFPVVGDWVAITDTKGKVVIHHMLTRMSAFIRKIPGKRTREQIVSSNIDLACIVCGLDNDYNLQRIERYLMVAWESGATPAVILNKCDLTDDATACVAEVKAAALDVPVLLTSAVTGEGLQDLNALFTPGITGALLGSSGAGKSTIINALLGSSIQEIGDVREDDSRGRHTTTFREMFMLPSGGLMIDTPGMRELGLWSNEGIEETFDDISTLAQHCRFRNCSHANEPGCAVLAAVEDETLDARRYESFFKLQSEARHIATKQNERARLDEKEKDKNLSKQIRGLDKNHYKRR